MTQEALAAGDPSAMGDVRVRLDDGSSKPDKVWIQLAEVGKFSGHPAGDFELSPQVFSQICANFQRDKLPIPIDMEHASEQEPTEGTIPTNGAPAIGWIEKLDNRGAGGLWGLVEWLEPAKSYIKEGKYKYISPAIRFESRDRVTGQPIGARLTSAGLTNQPFLRNMKPLTARDGASTRIYCMSTATPTKVEPGLETVVHEPAAEEEPEIHATMAFHPSTYMNKVRACLKMPDVASPKECADKLERLRDLYAEHGTGKTPDGVDMSGYLKSMRTLSGVAPGGSWDNVFDALEDMIDAAMDKHEIEDHGAGPQMTDKKPEGEPSPDAGPENDEPDAMKAKAAKATDRVAQTTTTTITTEGTNMSDDDKLVLALRDANGQIGGLTLELKDTKHKLAVAEAENEHLKTLMRTKEEADLINEVHVAFETYKDSKKLTAKDRPHMMAFAKSSLESFRSMYPVVPANQRYLMREVTPPAPKANADLLTSEDGRPLDFAQLTAKLQKEQKMSFADAQNAAVRMLRRAG